MRSIGYPVPKDSTRREPETVARIVNARAVAARTLARYRESETRPRDRMEDLEREVERIHSLLYELQARIDLPF